jgi:hypothetical protein
VQPTHPFLLFHDSYPITSTKQQEIACDFFWYKRSHEQRRLALAFPGTQRTGAVGRGTTKEQRRLQLMAAFGPVVDAACSTIGKTKDLLRTLTDHMKTLTIRDVSSLPQVAEPPTVMSTIVTAATAAAPAVTQVDEDGDEDEDIPLAHLGAANPRTVKHSRQKRHQPQSAAAPTTKAYKVIAKRGERIRKESVKIAENRVQGKTKEGKIAY